jgi:RNA polymerase sigma-70 factor, ECF subfamily
MQSRDLPEFAKDDRNPKIAQGLFDRDPVVLALLVDEHGDDLRRYLRALARDPQMADDLFQETWLRVCERGCQYNGEHSFKTWLFTIARNIFVDSVRRKRPVSLEEMLEAEDGPRELAAKSGMTPFEEVWLKEQQSRLHEQLRRLSPAFREIVSLRVDDDRRLAEIADMTHIPLSKVKRRLYRALNLVQNRMSPGTV